MVSHPRTPLRIDRLRALNLPQPVSVRVGSDGAPAYIELRDGGRTDGQTDGPTSPSDRPSAHPSAHPSAGWGVEAVGEVWRVDDEWWRTPIARHYVEVVLEGGKHVMLFEDLTTHNWFIQDI
jgi:hypothetical protein